MTPQQYRDTIAALGLDTAGAAAFLRISRMQSWRYAKHGRVPVSTEILLRLLVGLKISPAQVEAWLFPAQAGRE